MESIEKRRWTPFNIVLSLTHRFQKFVPDKWYLSVMFKSVMGYWPDFKHPKTFNEKLQWLKLYDRRPEYTTMVDKYAVKKYVAAKIGEQYIIPTLGVWDNPEDIEWDKLPNQFVLKCTHDSGGLVICRNKLKLDKEAAKEKLRKSLLTDYYLNGREWPYKNVPRRIIAEKYIESAPNTNDLPDYKFFCFNGEPRIIQLDFDRFKDHKKNLYSTDWKLLPFSFNYPSHPECVFERPQCLDEMLLNAKKLSKGMPYCRVDMYCVNKQSYFGELTLFPASGFGKFDPFEYDKKLGDLISLPAVKRESKKNIEG